MFLRFATVRRGSKTYRYAQIVESYRRESDGRPCSRILANLGSIDDERAEAIRAALALASGKATVQREQLAPVPATTRHEALANVRYLDIAVLRQLWLDVGLHALLEAALPPEAADVAPAEVVLALIIQRCVAPASKLAAEAWYPKTALPELQGISPRRFNNSRIHRVLAALDRAEPRIQEGLASTMLAAEGGFVALFIDATDTWFEGHGPEMAAKRRDKEGICRRRIGLVMLCDQRGFPLRWHTLEGRFHDPTSLADMAREAASLAWTRGLPLVMDRACGHAGATQALHEQGVHYVTALPDSELMSSGAPIPWSAVDALQAEETVSGVRRGLAAAGFAEQRGDRWVLDLGVFEKAMSKSAFEPESVAAVETVEQFEALGATRTAAALGRSRQSIYRFQPLKGLCVAAREHIRKMRPARVSLDELAAVAALPAAQQVPEIMRLEGRPHAPRRGARRRGPRTYPARGVVTFNPDRFIDDRRKDMENAEKIEALVADVNRRLASTHSRRTDASALAEVGEAIRKHGLGLVFTADLARDGGPRAVVLTRNAAAWAHRRRGDGIGVILAHPGVSGTAPELVERYFSKDTIEKDFQTIKGVTELRPVHHRTDPKVRAHVTLCVLALLLLRVLRKRLAGPSAESVLDKMADVRLLQMVARDVPYYTLTRPSDEVDALVKKLGFSSLISMHELEGLLRPR